MNKWVYLVIALVVLVTGFFVFNNYIYQQKQENSNTNQSLNMEEKNETFKVTPISHATMVLTLAGQVIYTDPVGGVQIFAGQSKPNIILVSDIHADHLDSKTLMEVSRDDTIIIVPQAVADEIKENKIPGTLVVLNNGQTSEQKGIKIEAFPMYNVPESEDAFHTKGRGNGYILEGDGRRIYVAGDTGNTPEMRKLQNIDVAFIPMNLPFTMSVEEAANAVLVFKPKVVHPYHYRGQDGLADTNKFKQLVNEGDPNIKVELLNFYPNPEN